MADPEYSIPFKIRFAGKDADDHRVEAYEGGRSILGMTRAIQIVTQSYLNQVAVSRATALHDGEIYLAGVKPGSLLFDFDLNILKRSIGVPKDRDTFFDFLSTILARASGQKYTPTSAYVQRLDADKEDDLLDLTVEVVEDPLKEGHRAIGNSIGQISIDRPRNGTIMVFDPETKLYLQSSIVDEDWGHLSGHVTRFNAITGNGRAYITSLQKIIPFRLDEGFPPGKRGHITWSLHGSNINTAKNLTFDAKRISSQSGAVKRLAILDCDQ